ncbi:MAG: class I SAM-dependent methyltransferase [Polyangiaceae bacterium]|nr:class I SAM-dependent methyltransferase [Polyangiaceae bacterium]
MSEPLLLHSLGEFACLTLPALEAAGASVICEIGAEHGGNTTHLGRWLGPRGGRLVSIDPSPGAAYLDWVAAHRDLARHVALPSLEAIPQVGAQDAWFVDGDHNWYTVFHELAAIERVQRAAGRPLLAFLHDVGWPWARRDLYYAPDRIPEDARQPHSWDLGVRLGAAAAAPGGFRGCGAFAVALREGGPRNGVLTAVEDFGAASPVEYFWASVPGVFGLGVLFDRAHPAAADLANLFGPLHDHPLLAKLERSRLANYLTVIDWQDRAAVTSAERADGSEPARRAS